MKTGQKFPKRCRLEGGCAMGLEQQSMAATRGSCWLRGARAEGGSSACAGCKAQDDAGWEGNDDGDGGAWEEGCDGGAAASARRAKICRP